MDPDVSNQMSPTPSEDLADVILADEDTDSIPTDVVNRTIIGNVVANANGIICWPNLEPMPGSPPVGQIQLAKFGTNASGILFSWRDNSS